MSHLIAEAFELPGALAQTMAQVVDRHPSPAAETNLLRSIFTIPIIACIAFG